MRNGRYRRPLTALLIALFALALGLPLAVHAEGPENGDFDLELSIDGIDVWESDVIVIDPVQGLVLDICITPGDKAIRPDEASVAVMFGGRQVTAFPLDLSNITLGSGRTCLQGQRWTAEDIGEHIEMSPLTGIFRIRVTLSYFVDDDPRTWTVDKNVRIPGNPMATPTGAAAAVVSGGAVIAIAVLVRAATTSGLVAGTAVTGAASLRPATNLANLVRGRLEPTARGRVMSSIVKAAGSRIVKRTCPLCEGPIRRGHCYQCRKSAKQTRIEYVDRLQALALEAAKLVADGTATTVDQLQRELGVSARLASDVAAVLSKSKLVKLKGIGRKLAGKAIMAGIGTGLSTILWVTVGGFAVLEAWALVAIIVASVALPVAVTKMLQARARREVLTEKGGDSSFRPPL